MDCRQCSPPCTCRWNRSISVKVQPRRLLVVAAMASCKFVHLQARSRPHSPAARGRKKLCAAFNRITATSDVDFWRDFALRKDGPWCCQTRQAPSTLLAFENAALVPAHDGDLFYACPPTGWILANLLLTMMPASKRRSDLTCQRRTPQSIQVRMRDDLQQQLCMHTVMIFRAVHTPDSGREFLGFCPT